ncbi:MAG: 23S rRNA (guanosine(2251)-2'-O)-methyltransferase RlmB [Lachnospiraceae bacterium]|nr:23S rRNA (guanosine(2251)-2'-O)-methyltransferase RlmB [Lachnospiraceae bacterium]
MINSTANHQIKNIILLQTKAKARNKQDCFIIEGIRMFTEVPVDRLIKTYVTEAFFENTSENVREKINASLHEFVSEEVFKRISDTVTPQGILAIVKKQELKMDEFYINKESKNKIVMILEDIQDPGNLGTMIRTAEAAGIAAVIMSKGTVDIYNPKVVRSTMGTIFRVPFTYVDDLEMTIDELKAQNIMVYAAHLEGEKYYYEADFKQPSAILIGNEGNGLSKRISDKADEMLKIPMYGKVESLNAACAATILMYETVRQNRQT